MPAVLEEVEPRTASRRTNAARQDSIDEIRNVPFAADVELEEAAGVEVAPEVVAEPAGAATPKPRKRSALKRIALAVGAAAVLAAGVLGGRYYVHSLSYESTDDAFVEGHVVAISPRVAGQVTRVAVDDNQAVRAGQVMVEIDPAPFQTRLTSAQAAESAARGKLAQAQAQLAVAQANVGSAKAELEAKTAMAKRDELELGHYKAMSAGSYSAKEMEQAQANADASRAAVDSSRRQLAAAEAQVTLAQSQILTARDEVASDAADARQAQLNLSYTKIVAPSDGRVTRKSVEAGSYVQPGQNLLAVVPNDVWVVANFKETQLTHMRPGQSVEVEVDAYPGAKLKGHVDSLQSGTGARFSLLPPENATGNYVKVVQRLPVKIALDEALADGRLLAPGMSVTPEVKVK